MPPGFQPEDLANPWVLVGMLFLLTICGGLVPRWLYKSVIAMKDAQIARQDEMIARKDAQIDRLIGAAEATVHIAGEIQGQLTPEAAQIARITQIGGDGG